MSGTASEVTWLLSQQRHCWSAVRHNIQGSFHCPTSQLVSCQTQHPTVFSLPNVTACELSDTTSNGIFIAQRHCWSAVRQHPTVFSLPNVTAGQLSDTTSNGLFTAQRHCWSAVSLLISCLTTGQLSHTTSNGLFYCPTLLLVSCQTQHPMIFFIAQRYCWSAVRHTI